MCNGTISIVNCSASSTTSPPTYSCRKVFDESVSSYWHSHDTEKLEWITLDLGDEYYIKELKIRQYSSNMVKSITVMFSDGTAAPQELEEISNKWLHVRLPNNVISNYINITSEYENRTNKHMDIEEVRVRGCYPGKHLLNM